MLVHIILAATLQKKFQLGGTNKKQPHAVAYMFWVNKYKYAPYIFPLVGSNQIGKQNIQKGKQYLWRIFFAFVIIIFNTKLIDEEKFNGNATFTWKLLFAYYSSSSQSHELSWRRKIFNPFMIRHIVNSLPTMITSWIESRIEFPFSFLLRHCVLYVRWYCTTVRVWWIIPWCSIVVMAMQQVIGVTGAG